MFPNNQAISVREKSYSVIIPTCLGFCSPHHVWWLTVGFQQPKFTTAFLSPIVVLLVNAHIIMTPKFSFLLLKELTAKWHVCKHTGHATNVRLSILRRKPFEGNQNKTENITKFKCQRAAVYIQDPRAKCSPSQFPASLFSDTVTLLNWTLRCASLYNPSTSSTSHLPYGLFTSCAKNGSDLWNISHFSIFKVMLYACFHWYSS